MSPLWRDRLIVGVAPERLSVVRLGKGIRPRPIRHQEVRLETDSTTPWAPALAALKELAGDAHWQTAGIEIILSSHFVQYAVIPADPTVRSDEERAALGAIIFRKTYGSLCQEWKITLSEGPIGAPILGAAVPSALMADLESALGKHFKIHAIRPALMDAFNRVSASLGRDAAIFALLERGRATIAQVEGGHWKSIVSRAAQMDDANFFTRMLHEEIAIRPIPETALLWVRDLTGSAVPPASMSGRTRAVPGRWSDQPAAAVLA